MKTLLITSVLFLFGCSSINAAMPGTYLNKCIKDGNSKAECMAMERQAFFSGGKTYLSKTTLRDIENNARRYALYEDVQYSNEAWLQREMCKEGNRYWC